MNIFSSGVLFNVRKKTLRNIQELPFFYFVLPNGIFYLNSCFAWHFFRNLRSYLRFSFFQVNYEKKEVGKNCRSQLAIPLQLVVLTFQNQNLKLRYNNPLKDFLERSLLLNAVAMSSCFSPPTREKVCCST